MKVVATLEIGFKGDNPKEELADVLAPDNEGFPAGLFLSVAKGRRTIRFHAESHSPSTAISTLLALLRDIALFQEVWLLSHGKDASGHRVELS